MAGVIDSFKQRFREGSVVMRLLYVNVGVFLLLAAGRVVDWLFSLSPGEGMAAWLEALVLPASWREVLVRPWTLFTYMFVHAGLWHLVFNMVCLYAFGTLFLLFFSARHLRGLYLWGGLCGGLCFLLSVAVFPAFREGGGPLMGASAAVLALIAALGTAQPDYPMRLFLLGSIRMKYVALGLILLSFLSVPMGNAGGELAHLGGALGGWLFAYGLQRGHDLTAWLNAPFDWWARLRFSQAQRKKQSRGSTSKSRYHNPHMRVYSARKAEEWQNPSMSVTPKESNLDEILDKLKRSGYGSLTTEEKRILFEASKHK